MDMAETRMVHAGTGAGFYLARDLLWPPRCYPRLPAFCGGSPGVGYVISIEMLCLIRIVII